jgi:prefoldin subunit 5
VENAYLQGRIAELDRQLRQMTNKLRDFEDDHYRLQATYDIVAQENDDLRAEIGRLRLASQSSQSSLTDLKKKVKNVLHEKGKEE